MIPLSSAISGGLTWSKISCGRSYGLKVNDRVVGTLQRPSFWSLSFEAETQSGRWRFRRGGWFGARSEILDSSSQQQIATFKSVWRGGGTLTFADGQQFQLECKGWWRPVWSVVGKGGETLLRLHTRERTVEVLNAAAVPDTRLSLLIMFTWYRILQAEEDAASAATTAVIAAS
jgi:hypothetical protein